jgi:hypothetical protein
MKGPEERLSFISLRKQLRNPMSESVMRKGKSSKSSEAEIKP